MAEQITIDPNKPINKGLDYAWLKELGINQIQQLSGDIWTDYNEHDPGVTSLEQLCYALTELSYRAEFPVQDLLMPKGCEQINSKQQALYTAESIFTCNPVTVNDYRKLIIDRIKGVVNVWLTAYDVCTAHSSFDLSSNLEQNKNAEQVQVNLNDSSKDNVKGLYLISVYAPDIDECHCDETDDPESLKDKVNRLYNQHRSLCEDVARIEILKPVLAEVSAVVAITGNRSANLIVAKILLSISLLFAPEPKKTSVQEKMMLGEEPSAILQGPLLLNGLIDEQQLQPKPLSVSINEVVSTILEVEEVINVNKLKVILKQKAQTFSGNEEIPVAIDEILKLETKYENSSNGFSFIVVRKGIELKINWIIVNRELSKLWKGYRKTYNLKAQYHKYFDLPIGQHRKLAQYYSIQNQYPNVYGINEYGIAENEPNKRHAQAKQLKGYLLAFEQILANYFSQLDNVKKLYSINPNIKQSYFYQYLDKNVPNVEPLLKKGDGSDNYHRGLAKLINDQDPFIIRRNRFLDVLLAMYGQSLESIYTPAGSDSEYSQQLINAKLLLLKYLIPGTNGRGRAMDYLGRSIAKNISGMQIKTRIQLGMNVFNQTQLNQLCTELGVEIVSESEQASLGKRSPYYSDDLEDEFSDLDNVTLLKTNDKAVIDTTSNHKEEINNDNNVEDGIDSRLANENSQLILSGQKITEEFIEAAASLSNYRIGRCLEQDNQVLLCRSPRESSKWYFVKRYSSFEVASIAANELSIHASQLYQCCSQLYLVEHNLLRFSRLGNGIIEGELDTQDNTKFNYSFTMSAVISASPSELESDSFRSYSRETVRQNSSANLALNYCFISACKMVRFEKLYWSWRKALRNQNKKRIITTSIRLKKFIERNSSLGETNVNV